MSEKSTLNEIFGQKYLWKSKYKLSWCNLCETAIIACPICKESSCNGSSCSSCHADFDDFNKNYKTCIDDYLTEKEFEIYCKSQYLKEFILQSLGENEKQIDFNNLKSEGRLSENSEKLFSNFLK
jgi:hypothetical protein